MTMSVYFCGLCYFIRGFAHFNKLKSKIHCSVCVFSFVMSQRHYQVSARRWFTLDFVELEYNGTKATFNGTRNIYAPAEYSYRCESVSSFLWPLLVPRSNKDAANQWRVSFEDIQVRLCFDTHCSLFIVPC